MERKKILGGSRHGCLKPLFSTPSPALSFTISSVGLACISIHWDLSAFVGLCGPLLAFVGLCWPSLAWPTAVMGDGCDVADGRGLEMLEMGTMVRYGFRWVESEQFGC